MSHRHDYYAALRVEPSADFRTLKKAYYRRAMECHPDRHQGSRVKEEEFKLVVEAFHVLSDPLARSRYDAQRSAAQGGVFEGMDEARFFADASGPILDTFADDILEELIVGNTVPRNTSLQTLMLDLERTEQFCMFREAKNLFYAGNYRGTITVLGHYLQDSPSSILAYYFLARCHVALRDWKKAERGYRQALRIGGRRRPPLRLDRIRRELQALRRKHLGALGRIRAALVDETHRGEPLPPDLELRQAVSRAINRMLMERKPDRKRLKE